MVDMDMPKLLISAAMGILLGTAVGIYRDVNRQNIYTFNARASGECQVAKARFNPVTLGVEGAKGLYNSVRGKDYGRDQFGGVVGVIGHNARGSGLDLGNGLVLTSAKLVRAIDGDITLATGNPHLRTAHMVALDDGRNLALVAYRQTSASVGNIRISNLDKHARVNLFNYMETPFKVASVPTRERLALLVPDRDSTNAMVYLNAYSLPTAEMTDEEMLRFPDDTSLAILAGGIHGAPVFNHRGDVVAVADSYVKTDVVESREQQGPMATALYKMVPTHIVTIGPGDIIEFLQSYCSANTAFVNSRGVEESLERTLELYPELDTPAYRQAFREQFRVS